MHLSLFVLLLALLPLPAAAAPVSSCDPRPGIEIHGADRQTVADICAVVDQALAFLGHYGLAPRRPIVFEIVETELAGHGSAAYGSYDSRSDRIQLMSYAAIHRRWQEPLMYGEPFDRVHYRGAIAHEVAHAVVQHNLKTVLIGPTPQEYLAHATQLAVLPEARRAAIIRAMDIGPWESGDAISDVYLGIEPGKFAVKSYAHLTTLADPRAFVEILLNAKWFYVYVP